ncbi:MAG: hypothetical protein IJV55_04270 [Paludibacteraceae bacterium]|nr:hypothetical protein [Paludibacteraceae bacterium]MBQ9705390.1 hypothetical protein [Paludibacteraceae bacterium]
MENFMESLQEMFAGLFAGLSGVAVGLLAVAVGVLSLLLVYLVRIHIAYRMAKNRHRDPLGWVLLSLLVSPLLTWIILLIAGDSTNG